MIIYLYLKIHDYKIIIKNIFISKFSNNKKFNRRINNHIFYKKKEKTKNIYKNNDYKLYN